LRLESFKELAKSNPVRKFAEFEPHVTSGPRNWGQRTVDSGDRFYRAQDILPKGRLASSGKVFIEPPDTDQGRGAKLKPGDLMIVITGATVGRVAVYPADSEPGYVSQHVAICRIDPAQLNPRFAMQGLLSPYGQDQILAQRYGQGKPGLNLTNIRNLKLPVPPLPVQQRVVGYLDQLEERIQQLTVQQAESREEIEAMLPAILDRAFKGEL
jgi:type I restriction enzyme S subunit